MHHSLQDHAITHMLYFDDYLCYLNHKQCLKMFALHRVPSLRILTNYVLHSLHFHSLNKQTHNQTNKQTNCSYFEQLSMAVPLWQPINMWYLRTAVHPVLAPTAVVVPGRARVMAALVQFDEQGYPAAHAPVGHPGGFSHDAYQRCRTHQAPRRGKPCHVRIVLTLGEHRARTYTALVQSTPP
jgi:hypothetical protein